MAIILRPLDTRGQSPELARLASAKALNCEFTAAGTSTWPDDRPSIISRSGVLLRLEFAEIDVQNGTAEMRGVAATASHLVAQMSGWSLHLLQTDAAGVLTVTSVFGRKMSATGRLPAAHFRSSYVPIGPEGEPEVRLYAGSCTVESAPTEVR